MADSVRNVKNVSHASDVFIRLGRQQQAGLGAQVRVVVHEAEPRVKEMEKNDCRARGLDWELEQKSARKEKPSEKPMKVLVGLGRNPVAP